MMQQQKEQWPASMIEALEEIDEEMDDPFCFASQA